MIDLVGSGGGGNPVRKAARDVVAAYLNAAVGLAYPYTTTQVEAMWDAAIAGTISFQDLHLTLAPANQGNCPF